MRIVRTILWGKSWSLPDSRFFVLVPFDHDLEFPLLALLLAIVSCLINCKAHAHTFVVKHLSLGYILICTTSIFRHHNSELYTIRNNDVFTVSNVIFSFLCLTLPIMMCIYIFQVDATVSKLNLEIKSNTTRNIKGDKQKLANTELNTMSAKEICL